MSTSTVKSTLEQHFLDHWATTDVQFDGVPFDYTGKSNWISLVYVPAVNSAYAFDGSSTGRILSEGVLKVFCYAQTVPLAFQLADSVKTFLNGETVGGVELGIGNDSAALNLENGYFEVPVNFTARYWA